MTSKRLLVAVMLLLGWRMGLAWADDPGRAGLVIVYGNGQSQSYCVAVNENSTGFTALQQTGLALTISNQGPGSAICAIEQTGCPAGDCFCQCRGSDCQYWSYWHWLDGTWQYSPAGAAQYPLQAGMIDGWVWGLGDVRTASPPPAVTFEQICPAGIDPLPALDPVPAGQSPWPYLLFALLFAGLGAVGLRLRR